MTEEALKELLARHGKQIIDEAEEKNDSQSTTWKKAEKET